MSATLAHAERKVKAEIINDGKCKMYTVKTYWTGPLGSLTIGGGVGGFDISMTIGELGSNGVDEEIFILCGAGGGPIV